MKILALFTLSATPRTMYLVSKTETFAKLFFLISFSGFLAYALLAFHTYRIASTRLILTRKLQDKVQKYPDSDMSRLHFDKDFKFVLLWTTPSDQALTNFGEGQAVFVNNNCEQVNCYMTADKNLLDGDYTNFDAVIFNKIAIKRWRNISLPRQRSPKQKYVFFSLAPASDNVICNRFADNYFNWTWSYKLYSNIFRPFIEVKDLRGKVIAPRFTPDWSSIAMTDDKDVDGIALNFSSKTKAVAWVRNDCGTREDMLEWTSKLSADLKQQNLKLDIYGCKQGKCRGEGCSDIIRKDYYFYLAYEIARTEDFVTSEVLTAYGNKAVPIVVGGADYTKYLPPGSYIDGNLNSPDNIAGLVLYFIKNPHLYKRLHRWRKFYTITEVEPHRGVCDLCRDLNDVGKMTERRSYEYFRKWWYPGPLHEVCLPKGMENIEDLLSYINNSATQNNLKGVGQRTLSLG